MLAGKNAVSVCLSVCIWMSTRVAQPLTAAHRDF